MAKKTLKASTMSASTMRGSLAVDSTLHLGQNDGWELWSYDTTPGSGFLIRDARQDPNKHRLEILYWKQDRDHDDTQFVLEAETGNIGIGVTPSTARLEVNGTVKATAFAGSGTQITGIKASSISEGVLAVERVPGLAQLSGKLPVTKIDGELSQWTTSGSALYYNSSTMIGASPVPDIGDSDAFQAVARAAANAQAVKATAQSLVAIQSRYVNEYQNMASSIATAADAATAAVAAVPGSGATTTQIAQAVVVVSQHLKTVAGNGNNLRNRMIDECKEIYAQYPRTEGIPDAKGGHWRRIADQMSQLDGRLAQVIDNVERSRQELEPILPALLARSLESNKLNVVGDGRLTGNLNCWGNIVAKGSVHGANSDLAENYLSDMDLAPADVVCLDQSQDRIVLSANPNDPLVIGVISSAPGFLLNAAGESSKPAGTLAYPVALCGRVPCKVTDENGPIQRGDLLTSASIPGHAMKAVPVNLSGIAIHRPGTIIGKALEALPTGKGVIEVFVNLR